MAPKTRAEVQKAYRDRKKLKEGAAKKVKKTRAEIQKAYRERRKAKGDEFLIREEENARKRRAYVPMAMLSEAEKNRRRDINREKAQRFRERQKQRRFDVEQITETTLNSDNEESSTQNNTPTDRLIVKFDFKKCKRLSSRKRISRGLSKAHRIIDHLKNQNTNLQRKNWALSKKIQRGTKMSKKQETNHASRPSRSPRKTPRSKTRQEIRSSGLSPKSLPRPIQKKLLFANVVMEELRDAASTTSLGKTTLSSETTKSHNTRCS